MWLLLYQFIILLPLLENHYYTENEEDIENDKDVTNK